jgi:hypothetical protein
MKTVKLTALRVQPVPEADGKDDGTSDKDAKSKDHLDIIYLTFVFFFCCINFYYIVTKVSNNF